VEKLAIVILAAGEGTRMKSSLPKVLHPICGRPMIDYVLETAESLKPDRLLVVLGQGADRIKTMLKGKTEVVLQPKQLGTGDAVRVCEPLLTGFDGTVLIMCGDVPLLSRATLLKLMETHASAGATATLLSAKVTDPTGYGRVIRGSTGDIERIVEEKDATPTERRLTEINAGTYCFRLAKLFNALKQISSDNRQKEYYLTDVVAIIKRSGETIAAHCASDEIEILGVNSREEMALAVKIVRKKTNRKWMAEGVTIIDPDSTFIDVGAKIGRDTVIHPYTFIEGKTVIGENCLIGPFARVIDSRIADGSEVFYAVVREAVLAEGAKTGPFSYLRPGAEIGKRAKVGTFVEIKKSKIGEDSKVPHLSYIGDALIGKDVNVGAGTITCNFDGR
jgi:bifunctional UDP-N-acetylglucosamine pyrophosphorylase/glucosamine-1-phosphate N-acetyltransferase